MVVAISLSNGFELFRALLFSEIIAKFSMVLMASIGQSAALGSNSPFLQLMKDKRKLGMAFLFTLTPLLIFGGSTGMVAFAVGISFTMFLVAMSSRSFGGITGDVLGATNELTRLSSLLIFVSL